MQQRPAERNPNMVATIAIEPDMQRQFHRLAEETHRPEAEIIKEALSGYLAADRHYVEVLRQRIESADRGEFADDDEVNVFFAKHGEPE
jgi:predicted transcriptional regulator